MSYKCHRTKCFQQVEQRKGTNTIVLEKMYRAKHRRASLHHTSKFDVWTLI